MNNSASFKISEKVNPNRVFILQKSEVEKRLDPNFYLQEFKNIVKSVKYKNHNQLKELVDFSSEYWNQKDFFDSTFPYVEISEIDILTGDIQKINEVEKENAPSRAKMIVRSGDIIVSSTRPHRGAISIIKNLENLLIASTGFSVLRNTKSNKLSKEYLFAVLRQSFSLKQMMQRSSGGNYPAITQDELGNIFIPVPSLNIQQKVIETITNSHKTKKQNDIKAEQLLSSIDDYLLKELGISLPEEPENSLKNRMFKVSIKEISGGRFDPKRYSQKSKDLLNCLTKSKYKQQHLKSLIHEHISGDWGIDEQKIIEGNDFIKCLVIRSTEFDNHFNLNVTGERAKYRWINRVKLESLNIKENDLLIEKSGGSDNQPVGRVSILTKELIDNHILCFSNFIHKIRINKSLINEDYLFNFLRTIHNIGVTDIMQSQTNGIRNLKTTEYFNIPVTIPPLSKQKEISEHITSIREEAKKLKEQIKEELAKANKEIEKILLK